MKNDYQPIISIIVPIYKTEKYLNRCLESLINQTLQNIEIICVNDGSPDNALVICEEYAKKDSRIILLSQTNQGLSAARNTGLLHAHGKYIQFCDSDDFFDLKMCEKMYNAIISSGADIVVSGVNLVKEDTHFWGNEDYFRVPFLGISSISDTIFKQINVFAWNKIYKKDLIEKFNIIFPYGLHYEDAAFFFKYLMVSKTIYCINDQLYNYVCRSDSIMQTTSNSKPDYAIEHIYVIKDVAAFLDTHNFNKKFEQVFIWMILSYTHLACMHGGVKAYIKAFETGSVLLKSLDFNTIMGEIYSNDDVLRLYALKKCDQDIYFSIDKNNRENERIRDENQRLKDENQRLCRTFNKRFNASLFFLALRSCILFPWYIYNIFYMVYNNQPPRPSIKHFVKAYLFFPYYTLKTHLTLLMRKKDTV